MDPSSSRSCSSSKMERSNDVFVNDSFQEPKLTKNDVFLNYLYKDIGNGFIRHLHAALKRECYEVSDHTLLPVGRDTHLELLNTIQESKIYVPVFSSNYASSRSCLDGLVHIMDCLHKFKDRKVLPVFFNVEPSDVRKQQGPFLEAFQAHVSNVDIGRVQRWKQALNEAGSLSGLTMQNGDEAKFLQEIVEELRHMKSPDDLYVTEFPVGLHSRALEVISTLRLDLKESVLIVAVFGISGIGKTTIVKETYNRIAADFEIRCFLANVNDLCKVPNWEAVLPNELISCLTRNDKFSVRSSHNDCKTTIRKLVRCRKVLLVLDDVDNYQQLEALGINDPSMFYQGSRLIIATRDKRSLGHIKHELYHMSLLNRRESLNLFTRLMVTRNDPVNRKFIEEVVSLAGGLPLVLKVWSRHFLTCGKEEWASELEELKRIPHGDVHMQLKKSYDSLTDRAKKLFLDIVCFFNKFYFENRKNLVVKVLQDEEIAFFPNKEIRFLADRSLVDMPFLSMPHAIDEMGKEIVRQENEDEPGQRTRLWDKKDVMRVLTECSGTESVESIMLMTGEIGEVTVQVEGLRKMCNLRLLCLSCPGISWSNCLNDEMAPLSFKKLKFMKWYGFPFKSINNVDMGNVVVLSLPNSELEILWEGIKSLKKLRILDVRDSYNLTMTGDFHGLENLEELNFRCCRNLKELHNSIGCLQKLTTLNLYGCLALKWIPWEMILNLPSLEKVAIDDTTGLQIDMATQPLPSSLREPVSLHRDNHPDPITIEFQPNNKRLIPNHPRNITSTKLHVYRYPHTLPLNISNLKFLEFIDFRNWHKLGSESLIKHADLANLSKLKMDYCGLSQVPSEIGNLVSLKELDLSRNTFSSLPDTLSNLSQLLLLKITECHKLRLLPLLPSNIERIEADICWSLKMMPFDSEQRSYIFRSKMFKESTIPKSLVINLSRKMRMMFGWCGSRKSGGVISFVAPKHLDKKLCGIIIYLQMPTHFNYEMTDTPKIPKILNKTKSTSLSLMEMRTKLRFNCYYNGVMFLPLDATNIEVGDSMELEFNPDDFASCGLRLIYDSDLVDSKLVLQKVNDFPDDYDSHSCPRFNIEKISEVFPDFVRVNKQFEIPRLFRTGEDDSDDDSMKKSDDDDSKNESDDDDSMNESDDDDSMNESDDDASMNESDDDDSMNDTSDDNSDCDNDYHSDHDDDFCSDSNDDYTSDDDSINDGDDEDKVKRSEIMRDAIVKLPANKAVTREDVDGVLRAERRNTAHLAGVSASIAASVSMCIYVVCRVFLVFFIQNIWVFIIQNEMFRYN